MAGAPSGYLLLGIPEGQASRDLTSAQPSSLLSRGGREAAQARRLYKDARAVQAPATPARRCPPLRPQAEVLQLLIHRSQNVVF